MLAEFFCYNVLKNVCGDAIPLKSIAKAKDLSYQSYNV